MSSQWNLRTRVTTYVAVMAFMFATMVVPLTAGAQANKVTNQASSSILVQGATADGANTFSGILKLTDFAVNSAGQLVANGVLNGTLTGSGVTGGTSAITNQAVTLPVSSLTGSCQILNLTLGPLDLNLLGLVVHLNTVVLNISAQPGPGNLLGNLLCAVAGLLNGGGALSGLLTQIANLLNQILGAL